jgi:hypothetical protein
LIEDVIISAIKQQPSVTDAEIISAFDYYMENDDFMEIEGQWSAPRFLRR